MPTVKITFDPSNKITEISSESGITTEVLRSLANDIEQDPLWIQSPADRQSNTFTTHTVEI